MARSFGNTRPVDVVFQVRDVRRDPNNPAAVLGTGQYNVPGDPGLVRNTVNATGFPVTGTPISSTSVDEVVIVDVPLTTQTDKAWKGGPVAIPDGGPATAYPLTRIRVTTRNTTPAKVDRLQIIDPAPGSTADPFNAFSFNRFVAITAPTGTQTSLVTLTYVGGATQSFSIAQALALTPADLAGEVSGVQVASDGRIAAAAAGVLEFEVRLRATHRDGSGPVTIANSPVPNEARGTISDLGGLGGHTATDLGVTYPTGPITVQKLVSGPGAAAAPTQFRVALQCVSSGVTLVDLPNLTLIPGGPAARVSLLPYGTQCTVTETPQGQTSQVIGSAVVGGPLDPIGLVRVENIFDVADLTIRKTVNTSAVDNNGALVQYGPFDFAVDCTYLGSPIYATGFSAARPMRATIGQGEVWSLTGLNVGAVCTIQETDAKGAMSTQFVVTEAGTAQPPVAGASIDVTVSGDGAQIEASNGFGHGSLALTKLILGDGGGDFGGGPFTLQVDCVLDDPSGVRPVWSGEFVLGDGNPLTARIDNIAAGATCSVIETDAGGAYSTVIATGVVTIVDGQVVTVTVENTFNAGSLDVIKTIDGPGAAMYGAGPFEVSLSCTQELEGGTDVVIIPGGATRVLDAAGGYRASYDSLPVGANCVISETMTGGATSTKILDDTGAAIEMVEIVDAATEITLVNTFELGSVAVTKVLSGSGASAHAGDTFTVLLECTWNIDGFGAALAIPGGASRTIKAGDSLVFTDLPVGAACVLSEPGTGGARAVTMTPADGGNTSRARVVVAVGASAQIEVDNAFEVALPPTGFNAVPLLTAGGLAVLIIGGGLIFVLLARRGRRDR